MTRSTHPTRLAAVALTGCLLAACGSPPGGAPASRAASASTPAAGSPRTARATSPAAGSVFRRPLLSPQVTVTRGGTYLSWQVSSPGSAAVRSELTRIDAQTGPILARRRLAAGVTQVLAAAGSLWVAARSAASKTLLRLSPDTIAVTGRRRLGGGGGSYGWGSRVLAVAGGGLWVAGGNRLIRLSLPGGRVLGSVELPGAVRSDVSANVAGTAIVVGEADSGGRGAVQLRDPATGALLASHPVLGVTAPGVAGPAGGAVWVSEATGMMGYVQRLRAATMTARRSSCPEGGNATTCVEGTNGITASLAGGLLWVTQDAGGAARNYCADPSSGRRLAPVNLPQPARDEVLAVGSRQVFYTVPGPRADQYLRQEPIPAACRAR